MNLGQVKAALAKFPVDMDSAEFFTIFAVNGKREFDLTCGIGVMLVGDTAQPCLVTQSEMDRVRGITGNLPNVGERIPGEKPPVVEGDEWKNEG